MSKRGNINDMMSRRTPLPQREVVEPVDMYTNPQVEKSTSPQHGKDTSVQAHEATNPLVDKTTSRQVGKKMKPQVEKYTTHLRPETIKAIKRAALDSDRKDYEVVQAALDQYLNQ